MCKYSELNSISNIHSLAFMSYVYFYFVSRSLDLIYKETEKQTMKTSKYKKPITQPQRILSSFII